MALVINDPPHSAVANASQTSVKSTRGAAAQAGSSIGIGPVIVFGLAALCWLPGLVAYYQTGSILMGLVAFGVELAVAAIIASLITRFA